MVVFYEWGDKSRAVYHNYHQLMSIIPQNGLLETIRANYLVKVISHKIELRVNIESFFKIRIITETRHWFEGDIVFHCVVTFGSIKIKVWSDSFILTSQIITYQLILLKTIIAFRLLIHCQDWTIFQNLNSYWNFILIESWKKSVSFVSIKIISYIYILVGR